MKKYLYLSFLLATSLLCNGQDFSPPLDTSFIGSKIIVPNPVLYDVLCISKDCTVYDINKGKFSPMKGSFGAAQFIPSYFNTSGDSTGYILLSHNANNKDSILGDGGALTHFKVKRQRDGHWKVVPMEVAGRKIYFKNVSFDEVGGTIGNHGLMISQFDNSGKKVLVAEDNYIKSNEELATDNSKIFTIPKEFTQFQNIDYVVPKNTSIEKYKNMNWMVEVDGEKGEVTSKVYTMGRFGHVACVKGLGGSYILTSGTLPSVLFKFQPYDENNINFGGELSAFRENSDGSGSFDISLNVTVTLPSGEDSTYQDFDSLLVAQEQALRAGATMFSNISGIVADEIDGIPVIYIAEKGMENSQTYYSDPNSTLSDSNLAWLSY